VPAATDADIDAVLREATITFSTDPLTLGSDGAVSASAGLASVPLRTGGTSVTLRVSDPGTYVLFCEHGAEELELALLDPNGVEAAPALSRQIAPDHEHDEAVGSVGITEAGELHGERFNAWLSKLLQEKGQDIFRMKGVLAIDGLAERFVFQGVHMLFDGRPDRPWGQEERTNKLIFIGRNLDRGALEQGFRACLA